MIYSNSMNNGTIVSSLTRPPLSCRFPVMNKSVDGWIMHDYGEYMLLSAEEMSSVDQPTLLLSHTGIMNYETV